MRMPPRKSDGRSAGGVRSSDRVSSGACTAPVAGGKAPAEQLTEHQLFLQAFESKSPSKHEYY